MYSMNDAVFGKLEFTHVWKGTCNVEFLGKCHALTLAIQGEPDKPVTEAQRRAFESAQKRLADTSAFLEPLLAYCRIDGPEDGLDAESLPYVVHPETLLITWRAASDCFAPTITSLSRALPCMPARPRLLCRLGRRATPCKRTRLRVLFLASLQKES